ncbi:RNA polymerase Rpc34 [Coccomyxa subellipsoidea C-169]|uniref:DNA-directed RNA polymerase III subunit RPC6 n=1 Tax=Coccomyxa subellipsoidea (strain C-169) TaxID=574566 RepID=I0Z1U2_COCSC|nr:RNA polymerase Rpc34 [Coccomyxa subellipsoidea C-169]EIE24611.1 RNA polymerase Rpc34 [Coccomyxa subellipsoidea C-169]|eukprot:XP_005649155.1 RNA polymerase Rpc34 [Coccomyxa subellipsoidea C-169]
MGSNIEESILALCRQHPEGLPEAVLEQYIPATQRTTAMNNLLAKHRLRILQHPRDNSLVYQEVIQEEAAKLKGLSAEDLLVYQHIAQAGDTGIWTKDLKNRTNLQQPQITKILKNLDQRSLVKSVKSVINPSRKVYILFELEPARELTGGAWYTGQDFDAEFIQVLQQACHKYIENEGVATLEEVADFVRTKGFSRVELRDADVLCILRTLEFDGLVESSLSDDGEVYRPARHVVPKTSPFTSMPCGVCPVINECSDGGVISPSTCTYYQTWLDF